MQEIAPNILDRWYLLRPTAAFSDNPQCTLAELKSVLTLDDLADMHEAMNLHEATVARAEEEAEPERERRNRNRRGRQTW